MDTIPPVTATPTNSQGVPLSQVQQDADATTDAAAQVAEDLINKEPAATITKDGAALVSDLEALGKDEVVNLIKELLEFKSENALSSIKDFFKTIGTSIGGLISKL